MNRKVPSDFDDNPSKRRKSDEENVQCEVNEHTINFSLKPVRYSITFEQELLRRKEQSYQQLQNFVNSSEKYSQFLQKKMCTSEVSTSNGNTSNNVSDIKKQLTYFEGKLRPYQVEGVQWLKILFENSISGILADEMGLGKTIQIIALLAHLYERQVEGPFLIVGPLSVLGNWQSEFTKFAPQLPVVLFHGSAAERDELKKTIRNRFTFAGRSVHPIVLCSYQTPLWEKKFLQQFSWQSLIVDEGHIVKNPDAQLTKELCSLKAETRTLLTGTPLQNDLRELWALFNFMMPTLFKNIDAFSALIELDDIKDKEKLLENESRKNIITTIHKVLAPFMLRREKKLVLKGLLVPKKEVIIYCPLTELQKYLYHATLQWDMDKLLMLPLNKKKPKENMKRKCKKTSPYIFSPNIHFMEDSSSNDSGITNMSSSSLSSLVTNEHVPIEIPDVRYRLSVNMNNIVMMLKRIVAHSYLVWTPISPKHKNTLHVDENLVNCSGKLLVLDAMLPKLKAGGHKVLIFSTFVMFLNLIEEMLISRGYQYSRFDGSTNYTKRNEEIDKFMNNDKVFIFLLSTRAGGLGLNLTAADTVIFMDRDWNPMADLQAQDRCHRIGQNKPVMVYSLISKGTIDEVVLNRSDVKKRLEKLVLQEGKFKTLNKQFGDNEFEELKELLEKEEKATKIKPNGLLYSDEELNCILDRSDLLAQMQEKK